MKEFENHHHYSEQNGHRMRSLANKKRRGIEIDDEQLSQDWAEVAKQAPKKKDIRDYPKTLPTENNNYGTKKK